MTRTSQPTEYIRLEGSIRRETDKAILFDVHVVDDREFEEHEQRSIWFPVSQMNKIMRNKGMERDWIEVAKWLVQKNALI